MVENEFLYEIIDNETDARCCALVIAEEFSTNNPITMFDQLTPTTFFNETSWPLAEEMFPEHLSMLVRDRSNNQIIGGTIAGDLYLQSKRDAANSGHEYCIPLDHLLVDLDVLFITRDFGKELKPNMVLHVELCGVRSQYSGKGIANHMLKLLSDIARGKGFQYILTQVTHQATRHIFINKLGGKEVTVIDPRTWMLKKKTGEPTYPYKDYQGDSIPNILLKLQPDNDQEKNDSG